MATNDLSPPDNISKEEILFLGWLTEISTPVSSSLFSSVASPFLPPKILRLLLCFFLFDYFCQNQFRLASPENGNKKLAEFFVYFSTPPKKSVSILSVSSAIISRKDFSAAAKSLSSFS